MIGVIDREQTQQLQAGKDPAVLVKVEYHSQHKKNKGHGLPEAFFDHKISSRNGGSRRVKTVKIHR